MKKILPAIQLVLALALLQGCASGPKFSEYAATVPQPRSGNSRVWFYRTAVAGAAVQPSVYLDGENVGRARPAGFFYADRPPGLHEAKCTTEWMNQCQFSLAPQSEKFIKLDMTMGLFVGHVQPKEVDGSTARNEISDLRLNSTMQSQPTGTSRKTASPTTHAKRVNSAKLSTDSSGTQYLVR